MAFRKSRALGTSAESCGLTQVRDYAGIGNRFSFHTPDRASVYLDLPLILQ